VKRLAALVMIILAGIGSADCSPACRVQGTGTVLLLEMEGGFYGIRSDSGDHYRPVNLPEPFTSPGLRIRFCADPVQGLMGIQMWGVPVKIREIEALDPKQGAPSPAAGTRS
jgi:hypothetical protein